jgi:ditrans,polycis-polyprenyl diphosphate synthase
MKLIQYQIIECIRPGGLAERYECTFKVLGRTDKLNETTKELIEKAKSETSRWNKRTLNLCIAYTSRDEMASAVRATAQQCCDSSTSPASITTDSLTARMYTAGDPPVDILVRTSGVNRFSDFLLWQCHQDTDIQIVDTLWPDFGRRDLFFVIMRWQRNMRRVESSPARKGFPPAFFIVALLVSVIFALGVLKSSL